jgi:hypothetical protein
MKVSNKKTNLKEEGVSLANTHFRCFNSSLLSSLFSIMTTEEIFVESKVQETLQKDIFDMSSQTQDSTVSLNQPILDRDLIEGRDRGEGEVASWFYNSNWPLLLARIPNKGKLSVMKVDSLSKVV